MEFVHTGLAVSSEANADRFFVDILGLAKLAPKTVDRQLAQAIFGIDRELLVLQYRRGTVHYEVFVSRGYQACDGQLAHSCIKVTELEDILSKCRQAGVKIMRAQKPSGVVTFVADFDGNLFELKPH